MSRVLPVALLFAASCVATGESELDNSVEIEERGEIRPVAMHRDVDEKGNELPGTVVFDTEGGRYDISALVPSEVRKFDDVKQFHEWAVATLGAQAEEIEGVPVVTLGYTAPLTLRYDRERDEMIEVDDAVATIVGGTAGYIEIGGEKICVSRTAECAKEAGLAPPEQKRRTVVPWTDQRTSPDISARGTTWIAHSSFVEWAFASTLQIGGGISHTWAHCGPLDPNWCFVRRGANFLSASYVARNWSGNVVDARGKGLSNVYLVETGKVLYGFYPFPIADGTCANHVAISNKSAPSFMTGFFYPFFNNC